MSEKIYTDITTPTGRIVSGNPFRPWTKDNQGNPLVYKSGDRLNQPRLDFTVGLAVAKADCQPIFDAMNANAAANFPTLFAGGATPPKFSWKFIDGDSAAPNDKGTIPNQKEGYPGHYIFFFSSDTAPKCFRYGDWANELIGAGIKTGDYVILAGSLAGNGRTDSPGLYLNLDQIALISEGAAIGNTGKTAEQAFAGANPQVPAGAVLGTPAGVPATPAPGVPAAPPMGAPVGVPAAPATGAPGAPGALPVGIPVAPAQPPTPGVPGAPMPPAAPPALGVPAAPPVVTQPHTGILNPQVAAPTKRIYLGTPYPESDLLAAGWLAADVAALPLA